VFGSYLAYDESRFDGLAEADFIGQNRAACKRAVGEARQV
jgi:hypothetical protein